MSHRLDAVDRRIVALLQKDGRTGNAEIARTLGLSEGAVRKRADRLLSEGIARIVAMVDPATVGLSTSTFIGIQSDLPEIEAVAHQLAAIPEVLAVHIVTGTYDVLIEVVLGSPDQLLPFLVDKVSIIPGVKRTETSHVLHKVKRACDWVIPDEPGRQVPAEAEAGGVLIPGQIVVA